MSSYISLPIIKFFIGFLVACSIRTCGQTLQLTGPLLSKGNAYQDLENVDEGRKKSFVQPNYVKAINRNGSNYRLIPMMIHSIPFSGKKMKRFLNVRNQGNAKIFCYEDTDEKKNLKTEDTKKTSSDCPLDKNGNSGIIP